MAEEARLRVFGGEAGERKEIVEQRREEPRGGLPGAVTPDQTRAPEAHTGLGIHMVNGAPESLGLQKRIGIQQHHIAALRQREGFVVRGCKPQIDLAANQADLGKLLLHHIRGTVARDVVDNKDFVADAGALRQQAVEALPEQIPRIEGNNDDGNIGFHDFPFPASALPASGSRSVRTHAAPEREVRISRGISSIFQIT